MANQEFPQEPVVPPSSPDGQPIPEIELHGYPHAVGRRAVEASHAYAQQSLLDAAPSDQELGNARLHVEVDMQRDELAAMPWLARYALSRTMHLEKMPPSLRHMMAASDSKRGKRASTVMKRLLRRDEDGQYIVPAETALNVMQWHNSQLSEQQVKYEAEVVGPLKERFAGMVHGAVAAGWMPESTLQKLSRLDVTRIYPDDGSQTLLKGSRGHATAFSDGSYEVAMAPRAKERTYIHELGHVIEGKQEVHAYPGEKPSILPTYYGGLQRLCAGKAGTPLAEAVNELTAVSLLHGYRGDTMFTDKQRYVSSLRDGWDLLSALTTQGEKPIDPLLFIRANLEDDAEAKQLGDQSAMRQLRQALKDAFPTRDIVVETIMAGGSGVTVREFIRSLQSKKDTV